MLDVTTLEAAVDRAALRYDRDGDQHYDVISAFIKSIRGSDVDAALHYLARMIEAGEDPRFIARRLVILASEDIGLADPTALLAAVAAADAVALIGMPEAPDQPGAGGDPPGAGAQVQRRGHGRRRARWPTYGPGWPGRCRRTCATPTTAARQGRLTASGYVYPHDQPGGVAAQQYPPDAVLPRTYYRPTRHGAEARLAELWEKLRALVRGHLTDPLRRRRTSASACVLGGRAAVAVSAAVTSAAPSVAAVPRSPRPVRRAGRAAAARRQPLTQPAAGARPEPARGRVRGPRTTTQAGVLEPSSRALSSGVLRLGSRCPAPSYSPSQPGTRFEQVAACRGGSRRGSLTVRVDLRQREPRTRASRPAGRRVSPVDRAEGGQPRARTGLRHAEPARRRVPRRTPAEPLEELAAALPAQDVQGDHRRLAAGSVPGQVERGPDAVVVTGTPADLGHVVGRAGAAAQRTISGRAGRAGRGGRHSEHAAGSSRPPSPSVEFDWRRRGSARLPSRRWRTCGQRAPAASRMRCSGSIGVGGRTRRGRRGTASATAGRRSHASRRPAGRASPRDSGGSRSSG